MLAPTLRLPRPPAPIGAYRAVVIRGDLGVVSGQLPFENGELRWPGRVGREVSLGDATAAAWLAALNACGQIGAALEDWSRFGGLLRLDGVVAAGPEFRDHARVLDGASQALIEALGPDLGAHARSAVSAPALPGGACVELILSFRVATV